MSTYPSPEHMAAISEGFRQLWTIEVPVTLGAVIRRINRRLAHDGRRLKTTRGEQWRGSLGNYYVVDSQGNFLLQTHVDVEALARELDVLQPSERIAYAA